MYAALLSVQMVTLVLLARGIYSVFWVLLYFFFCKIALSALQVGKLDAKFDFDVDKGNRAHQLPAPFHETPKWLEFWLKFVNDQAVDEAHKFSTSEALALMGSHTLIDNQVLPASKLPTAHCCVVCLVEGVHRADSSHLPLTPMTGQQSHGAACTAAHCAVLRQLLSTSAFISLLQTSHDVIEQHAFRLQRIHCT